MGLGLGLKLSRPQSRRKGADDEEQWYIPYNGPYEPPREAVRRSKARDSWGDPIEDEEDEFDSVLGDKETEKRFGAGYDEPSGHEISQFNSNLGKKVTRDRSTSLASGRSQSSGVDPSRGSTIPHLRPRLSSLQKPPNPSYVSVDAGGVGESPAPQTWMKEGGQSSRLSLASIFSFTSSQKKGSASAKPHKDKDRTRPSMRNPRPPKLKTPREAEKVTLVLGPTTSSASSDTQNSTTSPKFYPPGGDALESSKVEDDDYYNTYYSSLLKGPIPKVSPHNPSFGVNPRAPPRPTSASQEFRHEALSSHSIHPYAYTFPRQDPDPPTRDVPLSARDPPRLTFVPPPEQLNPQPLYHGKGPKHLRNASSTPNLRLSAKQDSSKSGDRWLSARNWCDAILFPRPRLKVKEEPMATPRPILSPPITPLADTYGVKPAAATPAFTSRVLAHSHSLIDLSLSRRHQPPAVSVQAPPSQPDAPNSKRHRPKSFALDDMSMVHPVLSLEKVLEEGEELENERQQWKRQAMSSLGNSRARLLSRTRSKSLTQKARTDGHRVQNSFDYLAARACLGSQNLTPILPPRPHKVSFTETTGTLSSVGRISHAHSNSLTRTKSSRTHSRGHSRNESGDRAGSRMARGAPGVDVTSPELDDKLAGLEGALKSDNAEVHQVPSSTLLPTDNILASRVSPTPSGASDVRMGIAISTPPLVEDVVDREFIRMPLHPYGQPGLVFTSELRSPVYGRPVDRPVEPAVPAQRFVSSHPYALALDPPRSAELVVHPRTDGNVSPQRKMWAQLSPGVVREILPSDLTYSPFLADRDTSLPGDRGSMLGVGEALSYTSYRDSRDSGLGTSESHVVQPYAPSASPLGMQKYVPRPRAAASAQQYPHREPVQYDARQPIYAHRRGLSADTAAANRARPQVQTERLPVAPGLAPVSPSPVATSGTPSPQLGTHDLGNPNDLDSFQDLFYRPARPSSLMDRDEHPFQSSSSGTMLTGENFLRTRRTGSGLTTLARQLSEEFEQMERERTRTSSSQYSHSSGSVRIPPSLLRRPTEGSLQFVFEEMPRSASPMQEGEEGGSQDLDTTEVFKPSFEIPEDVHSSASSMVERTVEDEDDTAMFRVGVVESVSTPPAETSTRRRSLTGFLSEDPRHSHQPLPASSDKHHSTLLSPITDMTRSSYMTTSTSGSRMSNLSDFPIPPRDNPGVATGHLSFLSSFHNENSTVNFRELETVRDSPHPMHPHDRRFTFGIDQNAADVADELSNPDH